MPLGSGMEMQRKGCYLKLSRKKTGLIYEGPGIQDDPPELPTSQWLLIPPGLAPTWPCSHLAYSQVCWGSRKGPRQGHCCHSGHLEGWTFSNPLFLYSENEES
jgi:hypothetical protein